MGIWPDVCFKIIAVTNNEAYCLQTDNVSCTVLLHNSLALQFV